MPFGKSHKPKHRHRPIKVEAEAPEVHPEIVREKRREKLNAPIIGTAVTVVGSIMMLVVAVMGAPYTYGAPKVYYSPSTMLEVDRLAEAGHSERAEADPDLLVDFTDVVFTPKSANSDAMAKVATICRQSGTRLMEEVMPQHLHRSYHKATRFLACAMATLPERLCNAVERKTLVDKLVGYSELRENVIGFEKFREQAIAEREEMREYQREMGRKVMPPLDFHSDSLGDGLNRTFQRNMENLVRNGYLKASDFGYFGFYVPRIYGDTLRVGADRRAYCPDDA